MATTKFQTNPPPLLMARQLREDLFVLLPFIKPNKNNTGRPVVDAAVLALFHSRGISSSLNKPDSSRQPWWLPAQHYNWDMDLN